MPTDLLEPPGRCSGCWPHDGEVPPAAPAAFRFSLAPACADPRGMKRFQRVVGTEVGFSVGAREPVF